MGGGIETLTMKEGSRGRHRVAKKEGGKRVVVATKTCWHDCDKKVTGCAAFGLQDTASSESDGRRRR